MRATSPPATDLELDHALVFEHHPDRLAGRGGTGAGAASGNSRAHNLDERNPEEAAEEDGED